MNYSGENSTINYKSKSFNPQSSINKSNVTLWKSKFSTGTGTSATADDKTIENEYIENLKKQIYFMEMELKLMKEREKEIEKSGGITQLFNDERDPSQHIMQLKQKYSTMRQRMEEIIDDLSNKKREITAINVSLRSKLENISNLTKEVYMKATSSEEKYNEKLEKLENQFLDKQKERLEIEATNRLQELDLRNETANSIELEYSIQSGEKNLILKKEEYEKQIDLLQILIKDRIKQYESVSTKLKELESKTDEEPYFKTEYDKNSQYKKKIDSLEKDILELNTKIEMMELSNDYLIKKKETAISDRKRLNNINDEIKKEIETKNQLQEIRIQKKVKEKNSEEIQKLEQRLQEVILGTNETEVKIGKEIEKARILQNEIIKAKLELKGSEEKRDLLNEGVEIRSKDVNDLKNKFFILREAHIALKEKISKEETDNHLLRNRNKVLSEEYNSVYSKYNFISNSSDYTSNLKKFSMDDMRTLTQTNTLVNESISNLVNKISSFKKENIEKLMDFQY